MLRIATCNVNGIRATQRRGFDAWLAASGCDVIALQEMRCPADAVPPETFAGWHLAYHPGTIAGRNGVAIASRVAPTAVREGFSSDVFDHEGRWIEADLDLPGARLTVASLYLPKGASPATDRPRYERKMMFLDVLAGYLTHARRQALAAGRELLVMGDFNIAHTRADLKAWKTNQDSPGFLPEERAWFEQQVADGELVDVVRRLHPGTDGPYSWWSWRGRSYVNDAGWRIDYHLATPGLAATAVRGGTDKAADYADRMSDHAPVVVDYAP